MIAGIGFTVWYAVTQETRLVGEIGIHEASRANQMAFEALYTSMRYGGGRNENRAIIKRLNDVKNIEEVRVIHGAPLVKQFGAEEDELPVDDLDRSALAGIPVEAIEKIDGRRVARFVMPFIVKEECLKCHKARIGEVNGAISVKISLEEYDSAIAGAIKNIIISGAFILAVSLALSIVFLFRVSIRPISELQKAARIIGGGDLDYRIDLRDGFEINRLVDEFNTMAERLKQRTNELNVLNKKLEELSITDGLTGVYNHRYFYARLEEELLRASRHCKPFAVIMADIDNFKSYNDTYGHRNGDRVLRDVASTIKATLRVTDLMARYGGEEFSVILPETDKKGAIIIAEKIRKNIEDRDFPNEATQPGGNLTVSVGVATYPVDAKTGDDVVSQADLALYRAKDMGRNRIESA